MQNIKVVLVEPCYQINIGYMARVMKNFGIERMHMVAPRCKYDGKQAIQYSKHAVGLVKNAKLYKTIKEATKDCDKVIGTTGMWYKANSTFFNIYPPDKAMGFMKKGDKVAILIGRDDIGLTKEELEMCDATVFIPTSKDYPVLNISHALAIVLYEMQKNKLIDEHTLHHMYAGKPMLDGVTNLFWNSIKDRKDIRNKKAVLMAFKHIINRANPTKKELNAISIGITLRRPKKGL